MNADRPQFAPRDPETMAETGPQNHPLPGTVEFVEGFAFTATPEAIAARAQAMQDEAVVKAAITRSAIQQRAETMPDTHQTGADAPDALIIVKRLRRKAEVMRLDAPRNSSLWYDLEEVLALVDLIAAQMGGEA